MWKKRTCNFDQTVVTKKTSKKANPDLSLHRKDLSKKSSGSSNCRHLNTVYYNIPSTNFMVAVVLAATCDKVCTKCLP